MGKDKYVAYVGTYTHGTSIGIHLYDVDVEEGTLTERKVVPVNNSSYVVKSKNGKYLYSIADEGVAVFAIDEDGDLSMINQTGIKGMRGCHLSVDDTGKYLYVGGYHDGKITCVHTHTDGRLGSIFDGVFHRAVGSVAERNFRPHVSCVQTTPDGKYVCAVDNGIDQVKIYRIDTKKNKLALVDVLRCRRESAPREIMFSQDGKYAYILFELINKVGVFTYRDNGKTPEFELIQLIETIKKPDVRHDCAAAMTMSPDGKFLFTSTAGNNSVTMFEIKEDGTLELAFTLPISGEYPKDIALFPDGKHIAVVNHESNSITTFTVDYEKKLLIMKGRPMKVETPNCILITKAYDVVEEQPEKTEE